MTVEFFISVLSLIATVVIGIVQIKLSKEQKAIKTRIDKIETMVSQSGSGNNMRGIIGNTNVGVISNNVL
jgi:hypothetical protein